MVTPNRKSALLAALSLAAIVNVLPPVPAALAQETPRAAKAEPTPDDKRWQAVAPGRIEPNSGEIKIAAPVIGIIDEVLVKANDKVFAGEPLIRLVDTEAQVRKTTAEAQVALRRRVRNDENAVAGCSGAAAGRGCGVRRREGDDRRARRGRPGRDRAARRPHVRCRVDCGPRDADARAGPAQAAQGRSAPRRERKRHAVSDPGGRPAQHRPHRTDGRRGGAAEDDRSGRRSTARSCR